MGFTGSQIHLLIGMGFTGSQIHLLIGMGFTGSQIHLLIGMGFTGSQIHLLIGMGFTGSQIHLLIGSLPFHFLPSQVIQIHFAAQILLGQTMWHITLRSADLRSTLI